MSKKVILTILLILVIVSVVFFFIGSRTDTNITQSNQEVFPIKKHLRMRYKLSNSSEKLLNDVSIKLYSLVPKMPNQKVVNISSSKEFTQELDELGNKVLNFIIPTVNPYQTKFIDIRVNLIMAVEPQNNDALNPDLFLEASKGIEINHPDIIDLSNKLKTSNQIETLKAYYDWIINNLEYQGYVKEDLGALYALNNKKGDCTEYAYLMAALARNAGIPTRVIGGYVYPEDAVVRAKDYHNWVEVFIDDKWHIIDPQKQRFMEKYDEYVAFRILNYTTDELNNSHQVSISTEDVKVSL